MLGWLCWERGVVNYKKEHIIMGCLFHLSIYIYTYSLQIKKIIFHSDLATELILGVPRIVLQGCIVCQSVDVSILPHLVVLEGGFFEKATV